MDIEELNYHLPKDLIADRPVEPREDCRLMVIHRETGELEHRYFRDLQSYLVRGDLLVLNSARVIPARIFVHLQDHPSEQLEILATHFDDRSDCVALIYPFHKVRPGVRLVGSKSGCLMVVGDYVDQRGWQLKIEKGSHHWRSLIELEGHMPIPPYILKRRVDQSDWPEDRIWYQTAYADRDGAIAAPTAGLHFSQDMLDGMSKEGVEIAKIFLKVGPGTFQPIRTPTLEQHALAPEEYEISQDTASKIHHAENHKKKIVAVGTTVMRSLEHRVLQDGCVFHGNGMTDLFILPPYSFQVVDVLITNFHLPKTTLLALVYAFGGVELIRKAYQEAMDRRYRFFSYGDAMMIL